MKNIKIAFNHNNDLFYSFIFNIHDDEIELNYHSKKEDGKMLFYDTSENDADIAKRYPKIFAEENEMLVLIDKEIERYVECKLVDHHFNYLYRKLTENDLRGNSMRIIDLLQEKIDELKIAAIL